MPRSGSIARLMVAMALIGLDLALVRSWVGPGGAVRWDQGRMRPNYDLSNWGWHLGELGPMAGLALIGLAIASGSRGRWRRCGSGLAATGMTTAILFFLAPTSLRHSAFEAVVGRADLRRIFDGIGLYPYYRAETSDSWYDFTGQVHYWVGFNRCPFLSADRQVILGVLECPFALMGGLLAAFFRSRPRPSSTEPTGLPSRDDLVARSEPAARP